MTTPRNASGLLGLYHGWWIAAVGFCMAFFAWGAIFYGNGFFIRALTEARGWSNASVSTIVGSAYLFGVPATMAAGRWIDRHGSRWVAVFGASGIGLGVMAIGYVTAPWQLALAYLLIGCAYPCLATITISGSLLPWFQQRLGLALGLALTGASIGGALLVPAMVLASERYGFRETLTATGLGMIALLVPLILLAIRKPAEGEVPPAELQSSSASSSGDQAMSAREILRQGRFWRLIVACSAALGAQVGFLTHQIPILAPNLGLTQAALTVSVTAFAAIFGRFALGALTEKAPLWFLAAGCYGLQGVAFVILLMTQSPVAIYAAAALAGLVVGAIVMLPPLLLNEAFGKASYGNAYGLINIGMFSSAAGMAALAGLLRDLHGHYGIALTLLAVLHFFALIVISIRR